VFVPLTVKAKSETDARRVVEDGVCLNSYSGGQITFDDEPTVEIDIQDSEEDAA
jgi:hypothetical protein